MPAAYANSVLKATPRFGGGSNMIRVSNRELISSTAGGDYTSPSAISINPALAATFPWLSAIAARWESYIFRSLRFEIVSLSPTSQAGMMGLVIDYDAADLPPASLAVALSNRSSISGNAFKNIQLSFDPRDEFVLGGRKMTRSGPAPVGSDIKTYDAGNLYVIADGSTGATGQLWVSYVVDLFTPQLDSPEEP